MCDRDRIWKDSVWEIRMKKQVVAIVCWLHIYTFQPLLSEPLCNALLRVGLVYLAGNQSPRAGTTLTISFVFHQYSLMPCLGKECLLLFDWQMGFTTEWTQQLYTGPFGYWGERQGTCWNYDFQWCKRTLWEIIILLQNFIYQERAQTFLAEGEWSLVKGKVKWEAFSSIQILPWH